MAAAIPMVTKAYKVYETVQTVKKVKSAIKEKKYGDALKGIGKVGEQTGVSIFKDVGGLGDTVMGEITGTNTMGEALSKKTGNSYEWLGANDTMQSVWKYGGMAASYKGFRQQYKNIKALRDTKLDIPSMDDFEKNRDEMMDILDTDPRDLSSKFDAMTLRKHGLDPDSIDAQAMLKKRGFRARQEDQQDEMARQFGRSGVMGSSAMAAAQTQMGIQGSYYDAQMGAEAERLFTQQISGLQQKAEGATNQLMSMEESMANWELQKQQQAAGMEQDFLRDVAKFAKKAKLGLETEAADKEEKARQQVIDEWKEDNPPPDEDADDPPPTSIGPIGNFDPETGLPIVPPTFDAQDRAEEEAKEAQLKAEEAAAMEIIGGNQLQEGEIEESPFKASDIATPIGKKKGVEQGTK